VKKTQTVSLTSTAESAPETSEMTMRRRRGEPALSTSQAARRVNSPAPSRYAVSNIIAKSSTMVLSSIARSSPRG